MGYTDSNPEGLCTPLDFTSHIVVWRQVACFFVLQTRGSYINLVSGNLKIKNKSDYDNDDYYSLCFNRYM